jgi:hypothetical protein
MRYYKNKPASPSVQGKQERIRSSTKLMPLFRTMIFVKCLSDAGKLTNFGSHSVFDS